jgi:7,8-dihydropterin-6-yl-methyl-4-(beta-D-ribofuranosyl)aminobenzene 5'-phosphate synthase
VRRDKMMFKLLCAVSVSAALVAAFAWPANSDEDMRQIGEENSHMLPLDQVRLTVVYDNNPGVPGLTAEWGFACLIQGASQPILFDTGGDGTVLLANMESLGVDPGDIDLVVLSHGHLDHTGGLKALLDTNPEVTVYVPESFSGSFKRQVADAGAEVVDVKDPVEICPAVYSVGELGDNPREQALALNTDGGVIVITGCAHPGILGIIERAGQVTGRPVLFAMGGFHMALAPQARLAELVEGFRRAGVAFAGPCHCSGDGARHAFSEAYGDHYIAIGVGTVVEGASLRQGEGAGSASD